MHTVADTHFRPGRLSLFLFDLFEPAKQTGNPHRGAGQLSVPVQTGHLLDGGAPISPNGGVRNLISRFIPRHSKIEDKSDTVGSIPQADSEEN